MLDFTSSSYLGLRHAACSVGHYDAIAWSRPPCLDEPGRLRVVGQRVARLQGEEAGVAGPSSLVLAMDALGPALPPGRWQVFAEDGCYPVLGWAACQRGRPVPVTHHAPASLAARLRRLAPGIRPVLVTDGLCMGCGRSAPLAAYAGLLADRGGFLLVDDTQALGLCGPHGGGTRAGGAPPGSVLRLASLSKAFNAPLAVLSGTRAAVASFRARSLTRLVCGPPSLANAQAALRALATNARFGETLRRQLREAIVWFRQACAWFGVELAPGGLPVQAVLGVADPASALPLLAAHGVRAFASRGTHDRHARLRLIITAAHRPDELVRAARILRSVTASRDFGREWADVAIM